MGVQNTGQVKRVQCGIQLYSMVLVGVDGTQLTTTVLMRGDGHSKVHYHGPFLQLTTIDTFIIKQVFLQSTMRYSSLKFYDENKMEDGVKQHQASQDEHGKQGKEHNKEGKQGEEHKEKIGGIKQDKGDKR